MVVMGCSMCAISSYLFIGVVIFMGQTSANILVHPSGNKGHNQDGVFCPAGLSMKDDFNLTAFRPTVAETTCKCALTSFYSCGVRPYGEDIRLEIMPSEQSSNKEKPSQLCFTNHCAGQPLPSTNKTTFAKCQNGLTMYRGSIILKVNNDTFDIIASEQPRSIPFDTLEQLNLTVAWQWLILPLALRDRELRLTCEWETKNGIHTAETNTFAASAKEGNYMVIIVASCCAAVIMIPMVAVTLYLFMRKAKKGFIGGFMQRTESTLALDI